MRQASHGFVGQSYVEVEECSVQRMILYINQSLLDMSILQHLPRYQSAAEDHCNEWHIASIGS